MAGKFPESGRPKRRRLRIAAAGLIAALAGGCGTVIDPELSPDPTIARQYDAAPTLDNAVKLAQSLREQYAGKVEDQILLDRVVGLTLIGAASAVAGLGATGGSTTAIIGTAIGGGALFGADTLLSSKPQQFIYAAGANAVQCALDTMHPMIVANGSRDRLRVLILGDPAATGPDAAHRQRPLLAEIAHGQALLALAGGVQSPIIVETEAAIADARAVVDPAQGALNAMNNAGGDLRSALASIQIQVTNAIITASPSIPALAESLGFALPKVGKPFNLPPAAAATKGSAPENLVDTSNIDEKEMQQVTAELQARVAEIKTIVSAVNERPSADKLKTCNVDIAQAGLNLTINPSGEVTVPAPAGDADNVVTMRVAGGVLPYNAAWIGRTPPASEVELAIESGQGIVTVKVKKGAQDAAYGILVTDGGNGSVTSSVHVTAGGPPPPAPVAAARACPVDPKVAKVQNFLLQQQIATATVDGKEQALKADGCNGPITAAAIKRYLKEKKNLTDDEIPTDPQDLIDSILPAT